MKTFGIEVLIVEPGVFRTAMFTRINTPIQYKDSGGVSDVYRDTGVLKQMVTGMHQLTEIPESIKGDPVKAARAILKAVDGGHDYLRIPLGRDCVAGLETKIDLLQRDLDATREIALSTDVDE